MSLKELSSSQWQELRDEHRNLVLPWITPRLERRSLHQSHPVDDFLFEYYPISTNKLLTWHPGFGYSLEASQIDFEEFPVGSYEYGSGQIRIRPYWLVKNKEVASALVEFLQKTQQRPLRTGCFGLHEWAMVLGAEEVRHEKWPLRLSQVEIRATIDEVGLRCTHFDAFRFFTPIAAASIYFYMQTDIQTQLSRNKQGSDDDIEDHVSSITNVSTDPSNLERLNRWNCAYRMFQERPIRSLSTEQRKLPTSVPKSPFVF